MSSARHCSNCKSAVPEEHFFCGRCGASYGEGAQNVRETLFFGAMQAPGRAKLILIAGEGLEGLSYHLNSTQHIAGRGKGVILFPEDNYLDEHHATFFYRANQIYLSDDQSTNGTFLRIREKVKLEDGDEFLVGRQRFRLELLKAEEDFASSDGTMMYVSPGHGYRFRLIHILEGQKPGSAYCSASNALTIGREGSDIIFPDDRHVSRSHARVEWQDGVVMLENLGAKNGVFVRIKEEQALQHGDYVFMGQELVRIEINA